MPKAERRRPGVLLLLLALLPLAATAQAGPRVGVITLEPGES